MIGILIVWCWLVVLVWLAWIAPRAASARQLSSDLGSGTVTGWTFTGTEPRAVAADGWLGLQDLGAHPTTAANGAYVVWTTSDGRNHWTSYADVIAAQGGLPADGAASTGDAIGKWVEGQWAITHPNAAVTPAPPHFPNLLRLIAFLGWFIALCGICGGDRPRVGTRWFWFWISHVTLGAGAIAYAVVECLRDPRDQGDRRLPGVAGFIAGIAAAAAITGVTVWL